MNMRESEQTFTFFREKGPVVFNSPGYLLTTNYGTFYVKLQPSVQDVAKYYATERAKGRAFADIICECKTIQVNNLREAFGY
jgi:hypothetical protein